MLRYKVQGSSYGRLMIIGGIQFIYLLDYPRDPNGFVINTPGAQDFVQQVLKYVPIAFNGGNDWVISENPTKSVEYGILLNILNPDKKVRVPRREFLAKYNAIYRIALLHEAEEEYND